MLYDVTLRISYSFGQNAAIGEALQVRVREGLGVDGLGGGPHFGGEVSRVSGRGGEEAEKSGTEVPRRMNLARH